MYSKGREKINIVPSIPLKSFFCVTYSESDQTNGFANLLTDFETVHIALIFLTCKARENIPASEDCFRESQI